MCKRKKKQNKVEREVSKWTKEDVLENVLLETKEFQRTLCIQLMNNQRCNERMNASWSHAIVKLRRTLVLPHGTTCCFQHKRLGQVVYASLLSWINEEANPSATLLAATIPKHIR